VYIQNADGVSLLVVQIYPGSRKPYHLKKYGPGDGAYVRVGSINRQASAEMVAALARESSGISFDQEPRADVVWDELDLQAFSDAFHRATGRTLDAAAYEKLGLASEARNDTVPTNAAILLSDADRLRRWFPYAMIECAQFLFSTRNGRSHSLPRDYQDCLLLHGLS